MLGEEVPGPFPGPSSSPPPHPLCSSVAGRSAPASRIVMPALKHTHLPDLVLERALDRSQETHLGVLTLPQPVW